MSLIELGGKMNYKFKTEIILNYIYENNLTKTQFCKLCNISYGTLNKVLNNTGEFRLYSLLKIIGVLKIKLNTLMEPI